jgi:hypothetical protein
MDFVGQPVRAPTLPLRRRDRLRELTTEPLDALKPRIVFRSLPDAAHECWCARPDAAHPRDGWREQEARQAMRATGAEAPVAEFTSRRSSAGTESRSGNAEAV